MDPTARLVEITDPEQFVLKEEDYPEFWSSKGKTLGALQKKIIVQKVNNTAPIYCTQELFETLQEMRPLYSAPEYDHIRKQINPFENLGKSIFSNRASLKLVNIDALYNVSNYAVTPLQPKQLGRYSFCDLAGGPGSHSQYLLWRHPQSVGYGITLRPSLGEKNDALKGLDWDRRILPIHQKRFVPFYGYGEDRNGDLYKYWKQFSEFVLQNEPNSVDFVTSDGGLSLDEDPNKYLLQEFATSHLVLCEILTALKVLKVGGNFVCKVYNTVTEISAQCLYMCALAFEKITMIKPITSRVANAERYVICLGRRKNIASLIGLLEDAANRYNDGMNVTQLFLPSSMSDDFKKWLIKQNDISLERQIKAGQQILRIIQGFETKEEKQEQNKTEKEKYYRSKIYTLWKIPEKEYKKPYQISREPTTNV